MQFPSYFIDSLAPLVGFSREAFEQVHLSGQQITSIRINPHKDCRQYHSASGRSAVPWSRYGYYLQERPSFTLDPLFHAGCYYVQEASSMFLEQVLLQTADLTRPLRVLDLTAAPGGKTTHIQSLITHDSLLVSNEVIRARAGVLKDNVIKWGSNNIIITNNDPRDFAKLEGFFDVIVVDAPCSGSGLFRRDPEAMNEWSENNVQLCCQRQQRILADVWPALKRDGILIYSTCSFSREEDEDILDWMQQHFAFESLQLTVPADWKIVETKSAQGGYGYRFWPYLVKGEGFFIACGRKKEGMYPVLQKIRKKPEKLTRREMEILEKWIGTASSEFIKNNNTVYAWPPELVNDFSMLLNLLRVVYSGTIIGEIMRDKLVPNHALAMSKLVQNNIASTDLEYSQAIDYLKRKEVRITNLDKGWHLVKYEGFSLGWINVLSNRINNYYPVELRILKDPGR